MAHTNKQKRQLTCRGPPPRRQAAPCSSAPANWQKPCLARRERAGTGRGLGQDVAKPDTQLSPVGKGNETEENYTKAPYVTGHDDLRKGRLATGGTVAWPSCARARGREASGCVDPDTGRHALVSAVGAQGRTRRTVRGCRGGRHAGWEWPDGALGWHTSLTEAWVTGCSHLCRLTG